MAIRFLPETNLGKWTGKLIVSFLKPKNVVRYKSRMLEIIIESDLNFEKRIKNLLGHASDAAIDLKTLLTSFLITSVFLGVLTAVYFFVPFHF